jgi:pyruvate dehydrogenase E1 component alpha subunit
MPDPEPLAMFENIYSEPNALLDAEREQFAAYLDTFETEEVAQ